MGLVYEAVHTENERVVAVKEIIPGAQKMMLDERFRREAKVGAAINHPNVAMIYDSGTEGDNVYIVMELLQGEDLEALLRRCGALSPSDAAKLLLPVLSALQYIHDREIIHRDLKPANIFLHLDANGLTVPKLIDFGLSKSRTDKQLTATNMIAGTLGYCSPEQIRDMQNAGFKTDIYSFGVILYRCVVGSTPFPTSMNDYDRATAILNGIFTQPRQVRPSVPEALEQIICRAMRVDPNQRFADAREMALALQRFEHTETTIGNIRVITGTEESTASGSTNKKTTERSTISEIIVDDFSRETSGPQPFLRRRLLLGAALLLVGIGSLWTLASIVHPPAPVAVPATVVPLAASPSLQVLAMPLPQEGPVETPAAAPTPQVVQPLHPDALPVVEPTRPAPASSPPGHSRIIGRPRRTPAQPRVLNRQPRSPAGPTNATEPEFQQITPGETPNNDPPPIRSRAGTGGFPTKR